MFDAHIGGEPARGTLGRILAGDDIHHGTRAPRELRRKHKHTAGLRHRERGVLAGVERLFDNARPLGGIQLCSDAMNEHTSS